MSSIGAALSGTSLFLMIAALAKSRSDVAAALAVFALVIIILDTGRNQNSEENDV